MDTYNLEIYSIRLMFHFRVRNWIENQINMFDRGVVTGGSSGTMAHHFNIRTKEGPTSVSVSNIRNIVFYRCSEIIRTRNFTIFTMYAIIFG